MSRSPISPHSGSPAELQERLTAERSGDPFLIYLDNHDRQRIRTLAEGFDYSIGRHPDSDISLVWDERVSGLHAELRRAAGSWVIADDGLSRNGTSVNGERVIGRRRLSDRDQIEVGRTAIVFREPLGGRGKSTAVATDSDRPEVTPAQRRVLVALCRPFKDAGPYARPPTNEDVAEELVLSVAAVKTHLRALFQRFGLDDLPQNEKRARLIENALTSGVISPRELA